MASLAWHLKRCSTLQDYPYLLTSSKLWFPIQSVSTSLMLAALALTQLADLPVADEQLSTRRNLAVGRASPCESDRDVIDRVPLQQR